MINFDRVSFNHCRAGSLCNVSVFLCYSQRHDECADQEPTECTCGLLRDHILPPWAIYPVIKVQNYPLAHLKHIYSTNRACHTNAEHQRYSPGLFLLAGEPFSPVWHFDGNSVFRFFFVLKNSQTAVTFSLVYLTCSFAMVPTGETKQRKEWLLQLNRWQRAQYYPWWTSASGVTSYQYSVFSRARR